MWRSFVEAYDGEFIFRSKRKVPCGESSMWGIITRAVLYVQQVSEGEIIWLFTFK